MFVKQLFGLVSPMYSANLCSAHSIGLFLPNGTVFVLVFYPRDGPTSGWVCVLLGLKMYMDSVFVENLKRFSGTPVSFLLRLLWKDSYCIFMWI